MVHRRLESVYASVCAEGQAATKLEPGVGGPLAKRLLEVVDDLIQPLKLRE